MPDSANLYIYARNNPIRYQDPDGHDPEENEFAILREMGLTEYLKRSYKMIWDELSYSNEHFATFGTFDLLTYAFSGLEYGILKANGADINYLEVLSRNQTAKAYGFIDSVADFSIGALEASIKKAGANYKNLYNYIKSNIDGSCQDNIDTRFRTIKLMSQQALTGLPVYDFYEIDKYIHSKEFRNKVVLEALGTEIEIVSVGGIGNYVKQKYLQYLDSPEVTDVYYGFGYTAGVLVDIIIGEYLESELVGAVFKDTSNTAQAAPKAEKAVAESGEEVLEQAEKAAGKAVEESGEEILEQTGKAIESGKKTIKSTLGNEIDVTPSSKHTSVNKNSGPYGEANTSVDILDAEGNIKTRRWYDSDGKAYRDVDMSDHGNPKEHPEVPHEHTWEYNNGKPKRN